METVVAVATAAAADWQGNWELTFQAPASGLYTLYASLGCGYQPNIFALPVDPSTGKIDASSIDGVYAGAMLLSAKACPRCLVNHGHASADRSMAPSVGILKPCHRSTR